MPDNVQNWLKKIGDWRSWFRSWLKAKLRKRTLLHIRNKMLRSNQRSWLSSCLRTNKYALLFSSGAESWIFLLMKLLRSSLNRKNNLLWSFLRDKRQWLTLFKQKCSLFLKRWDNCLKQWRERRRLNCHIAKEQLLISKSSLRDKSSTLRIKRRQHSLKKYLKRWKKCWRRVLWSRWRTLFWRLKKCQRSWANSKDSIQKMTNLIDRLAINYHKLIQLYHFKREIMYQSHSGYGSSRAGNNYFYGGQNRNEESNERDRVAE